MLDWMLAKMKLTEEEMEDCDLEVEEEPEQRNYENFRLPCKRRNIIFENNKVFYKKIKSYEDCNLMIDNYKQNVICIYSIGINEETDAKDMMNYICGAVYALDGEIVSAGRNVFWLC